MQWRGAVLIRTQETERGYGMLEEQVPANNSDQRGNDHDKETARQTGFEVWLSRYSAIWAIEKERGSLCEDSSHEWQQGECASPNTRNQSNPDPSEGEEFEQAKLKLGH
jgi:hypothetical protein